MPRTSNFKQNCNITSCQTSMQHNARERERCGRDLKVRSTGWKSYKLSSKDELFKYSDGSYFIWIFRFIPEKRYLSFTPPSLSQTIKIYLVTCFEALLSNCYTAQPSTQRSNISMPFHWLWGLKSRAKCRTTVDTAVQFLCNVYNVLA